jgi:hypothetical protein
MSQYVHLCGKFPNRPEFGICGGDEKTMPYWTIGRDGPLTDPELWMYYGAMDVPGMEPPQGIASVELKL